MTTKIKTVENVKISKAANVIEPVAENNLLSFTLPDETQTAGDFIQDDVPATDAPDAITETSVDVNENNEAEKSRGTPDKKGNAYDPLIHHYPPEMTPTGRWKKKTKAKVKEAVNDEVKSNTEYRSEADKFAKLYASLHMLPFGKDGAIDDVKDLVPLTDDIERYMQENGHSNISAGWAIAISAGLYSVGVAQREPNVVKVKRWLSGTWEKVKGLFSKSKKKPKQQNLDKHRTQAESSKPQPEPAIVESNGNSTYTNHGF